jgi:hypothetical protein
MTTMDLRHGELLGAEWSARPLRPVARWISEPDETGRARLRMAWSVPEVTPAAVTRTDVTPTDVDGSLR